MKAILFFLFSIITVQLLIAQDTVILKNGKVVPGKIISLSYGIELLTAKDTMKYTADEVASIMFCSTNKNCPCDQTINNSRFLQSNNGNTKDDPCKDQYKQNESPDKIKPNSSKNSNGKY